MFDYTICNCADRGLFQKQCAAIECAVTPLEKAPLLEDVDGTLVQQYVHSMGKIIVKNDEQIDSLYVQAEFELLPYFKKKD